MLQDTREIQVVGEAGSGIETVQLVRELRPQVVIIRLSTSSISLALEVYLSITTHRFHLKISCGFICTQRIYFHFDF